MDILQRRIFSVLIPGFSRTPSMYSSFAASQWHQPSRGLYNEEKNKAPCSQHEDSFQSCMNRKTESLPCFFSAGDRRAH